MRKSLKLLDTTDKVISLKFKFPTTLFSFQSDMQMREIMELAHKFLQNFCFNNSQNQTLLHKFLDKFLNSGLGVSRKKYIQILLTFNHMTN